MDTVDGGWRRRGLATWQAHPSTWNLHNIIAHFPARSLKGKWRAERRHAERATRTMTNNEINESPISSPPLHHEPSCSCTSPSQVASGSRERGRVAWGRIIPAIAFIEALKSSGSSSGSIVCSVTDRYGRIHHHHKMCTHHNRRRRRQPTRRQCGTFLPRS